MIRVATYNMRKAIGTDRRRRPERTLEVLREIAHLRPRTNTFGAVHHTDREETWIGPALWRTTGSRWCYEYELAEEGILHSPMLVLEKDRNGTGGQTK